MLFRTNDAAPLKQTVYPRRQSKSSSTISEASVLFGLGFKNGDDLKKSFGKEKWCWEVEVESTSEGSREDRRHQLLKPILLLLHQKESSTC